MGEKSGQCLSPLQLAPKGFQEESILIVKQIHDFVLGQLKIHGLITCVSFDRSEYAVPQGENFNPAEDVVIPSSVLPFQEPIGLAKRVMNCIEVFRTDHSSENIDSNWFDNHGISSSRFINSVLPTFNWRL